MTTDPNDYRESVAAAVLASFVGLTGLATLINAAVTATGHPLLVGIGATVAAVLAVLGRWVVARVRDRREEAADAVTAAAWRAQHMPHLAAQIERDRAGVA